MSYSYYTNVNIGYLNNIVTVETDKAVSGLQIYIRIIVAIVFVFVYVTAAFYYQLENNLFGSCAIDYNVFCLEKIIKNFKKNVHSGNRNQCSYSVSPYTTYI